MGRGKILSGGEGGLYLLERTEAPPDAEARIRMLDEQRIKLSGEVDQLYLRELDLITEQEAARLSLDALLKDWIEQQVAGQAGSPDGKVKMPDPIKAAIKKQAKAAAELREARRQLKMKRAELKEREQKLAVLRAAQVPIVRETWCADRYEYGTGEVATIEVPGEPQQVVIAPNCPPPKASDGRIEARATQDPNQAFFNAAILPGLQKFKPTYRIGVIESIDKTASRASVTLEAAKLTSQNLSVNKVDRLENVPVLYMTCGASAFKVGDRCVVEFSNQSWDSPNIIGFVDHPRECLSVNYTCDPGGHIVGNAFQKTYPGGECDPVSVVVDDSNKIFLGWSDGKMEMTRQDSNVQFSSSIAAMLDNWPEEIRFELILQGGGEVVANWVRSESSEAGSTTTVTVSDRGCSNEQGAARCTWQTWRIRLDLNSPLSIEGFLNKTPMPAFTSIASITGAQGIIQNTESAAVDYDGYIISPNMGGQWYRHSAHWWASALEYKDCSPGSSNHPGRRAGGYFSNELIPHSEILKHSETPVPDVVEVHHKSFGVKRKYKNSGLHGADDVKIWYVYQPISEG